MDFSQPNKPLIICATLLLLISGYFFGANTLKFFSTDREERKAREADLSKRILDISDQVDKAMANTIRSTHLVKRHLENHAFSDKHGEQKAIEALKLNPELSALGFAFAEGAHPSKAKRHYRCYERFGHRIKETYLDNDYLASEVEWYQDTVFEGEQWIQPFYDRLRKDYLIAFASPFRLPGVLPDQPPSGVIFGGVDLQLIRNQVAELGAGDYGYAMMFTNKGHFVVHPRQDWIGVQKKTLFERVWERGSAAQTINTMAIEALHGVEVEGEARYKDYMDDLTGQEARVFFRRLDSSEWVLAVVTYKDRNQSNAMKHEHSLAAVLSGLLFLSTLGLLGTFIFPGLRAVELMATFVSLLFCLGLGSLWIVADKYPWKSLVKQEEEKRLLDEHTLAKHIRSFEKTHGEVIKVPTGVFIQNVNLASETEVVINGIIWQTYDDVIHKGLERGILFPEAQKPPEFQVFREKVEGGELIRWYFTVQQNIKSEHNEYPFDEPHISLRFWHRDFDKNVVLIPDLDSYKIIKPDTLPGISSDLNIAGWSILESYFSYNPNTYNTDFGGKGYQSLEEFPELYYSLTIKREFLSPFISKVIPVLVMAVLLYCILLTISNSKRDIYGFSGTNVILGCAALFFVVIFEHISLRSALESSEIIYFEYFYFALYIMMILVMVDAILFSSHKNIRWLEYRDNFIPKILYWPILLGVLFFMTLMVIT